MHNRQSLQLALRALAPHQIQVHTDANIHFTECKEIQISVFKLVMGTFFLTGTVQVSYRARPEVSARYTQPLQVPFGVSLLTLARNIK